MNDKPGREMGEAMSAAVCGREMRAVGMEDQIRAVASTFYEAGKSLGDAIRADKEWQRVTRTFGTIAPKRLGGECPEQWQQISVDAPAAHWFKRLGAALRGFVEAWRGYDR